MMTDTRTAGETFAHLIRLHLDNDEGIYNARRQLVADTLANVTVNEYTADALGHDRAAEMAQRSDVADALKDFATAIAFDADPDRATDSGTVTLLAMDLLTHALGMVDWFEMADDYIAEHNEEI